MLPLNSIQNGLPRRLPRRKERVKHGVPHEAQPWGLIATCHLNYHEHKKKEDWAVHQRAWAHCRSPSPELPPISTVVSACCHLTADKLQPPPQTHTGCNFSALWFAPPPLGSFFESMTSQAYFLLTIHTKTIRATKHSQSLLKENASSVDVLALSFSHIQCTKGNLPWESLTYP